MPLSDLELPDAASSRSLLRPLVYGLGLSLLLLSVLLAALWLDYQRKIESAQQRAVAIATGNERLLAVELRNLERALRGIAQDSQDVSGQDPEQARRLRLALVKGVDSRHAEMQDVELVDRKGHPFDDPGSPGDPSIASWTTDRQNQNGADDLIVGPPQRGIHGEWLIPLAWPLPAGVHGGGWVLAHLRQGTITTLTGGLDVGAHGVTGVLDRHGRLLARTPTGSSDVIGMDVSKSELMKRVLAGAVQGSGDWISPVDGERRLVAYRALQDYPLLVSAGLSRAEVLGTWYGFAGAAALACLAYVLGWMLLARLLWRSSRRQTLLVSRLASSRETLLEAQRVAGLGWYRLELSNQRVSFSPEAMSIYGFGPADLPLDAEACLARTHPEDREWLRGEYERHIREDHFPDTRYRVLRPDGSERLLIARGRIVDTASGRAMIGTLQDITELTQTAERLREAESQYRLLFERNPMPFWVFHRQSLQILEANDAALAHYGYSREEFLSMGLRDLRPAEDIEEAERVARLGEPERRRGRIWRHVCRDGRIIRVAVHSADIDFKGQPARLVLALDVTAQLAAQELLELSEARFQLVARATSDAVFDWDIVTGAVWRSQSFDKLFGYGEHEVPDTIDAWQARLHPDDRELVDKELTRFFYQSQELDWSARYRFRRGDGQWAQVLDRGVLERDARGKPLRMVGGMMDVSRQYQDEAELHLLRRAIESADNGIALVDAHAPDLPLVYVNPAFERITGYTASEVLGRNCRFLQGPERAQEALEEVRAAITDQRETRVMLRNYRRDGQLFFNQFSLAPVRGDDGELTHFVGVLNDVSERQRFEADLAYQASHDELTGLLNRTAVMAAMERLIQTGSDATFSLLYLDINNFKLINDSLGHEVGDAVLQAVATRLIKQAGAERVGRLGGNEFLALVPGTQPEEQIAAILAALTLPIQALSTLHYLSLNSGIARYPEHGFSADQLLRNAGIASHEAHRRGHNRQVEYSTDFDRSLSDRQQLVAALHEAMEREQFELYFQPLYGTDRKPIGLEALIRWNHPERGLVPPSEFIPVAEDSGLIVPLGRWVLREACRHHRLLADAGWGGLSIAVNVSAMQFLSGELQGDIPALLGEFQVPHGVLELELTESLVMENPEPVIEVMRELRQYGVLLSIDDFGTGYSSMSYLHRLPVDKLKIDRSFVSNVESDHHNAAICESIMALARSFDLKVIAEGVETQAQFDWLQAHNCDEVQGYLLARPMPFAQLVASLTMAHGRIAPAR